MNRIDYKNNGIDFVRYYAAISVMTLHFSGLYMQYCNKANNEIADFFRCIALSIPGVVILFAISGFFVMASLQKIYDTENERPLRTFFVNKAIRLFPEYWLCTVINIIVIVILAADKLDKSFSIWIVTQIFGIANTPGCLKNFATGSVNGPLWTVFVQIQIYFVLGITYKYLRKLSVGGWIVLIGVSTGLNGVCKLCSNMIMDGRVQKLIERTFVPYIMWAFIGAFIFSYKDIIIPTIKKFFWVFILILLAVGAISYNKSSVLNFGYYSGIITGILTPISTMGISYFLPAKRIKDISYSMFLYHWIVINVMVNYDLFNRISGMVCLVIFVLGTVVISVISNMIIERINKMITKRREQNG